MSRPTQHSDLTGIATPADAPGSMRFPSLMKSQFELLRRASYPGGTAQERGGSIFADAAGNLFLQNLGGLASTGGSFSYDLVAKDPAKFTLVGTFHTHPYDRSEGSYNGVSFSGADIYNHYGRNIPLTVVQSGPRLFAMLRTGATTAVPATRNADTNREVGERVANGATFQQASRQEAQETATQFGFAYYQGKNGVVAKV